MHPHFTMNFADREMFAYNAEVAKKKAEVDRVLSHPEQRMRYAFEFLADNIEEGDTEMTAKCFNAIAKYSSLLDYAEAHY